MIWHLYPGQLVRLIYRRSARQASLELLALPRGATGRVVLAGHGPGPHNALVDLADGRMLVIPPA